MTIQLLPDRCLSNFLWLAVNVTLASLLLPNAFATSCTPGDDPAETATSQDKQQPPRLTKAELESLIAALEEKLDKKSDSNTRFDLAERYLQLSEAVLDSDSKSSQVYWSRSCKLNDELCDLISIINLQTDTQFKHFYFREGDTVIVDPVQVAKSAQELSVKLAKKIEDPQQQQLVTIQGYRLLGTFQTLSRQLESAKENLLRAVEAAETALKDHPQSKDIRLQLAKGRQTLGVVYLQLGDVKSTLNNFEKMIEHCRALTTQDPKDREFRSLFSRGLTEFSALLELAGKLPEAQKYAKEGVAVAAQLAEDFPTLKSDLAAAHNRLGAILIKANDLPTAQTQFELACKIHEATESATPLARNELAGSMVNLAVMFYKTGKVKEARELLIGARPIHLKAMEAEPQNGLFRFFFRNNRSVLILSCLALKNHSEAFATLDELLKYSDNPSDRLVAAKTVAQCMDIAKSDKSISSKDLDSILTKYSQLAMTLLNDMAQKGLIDAGHLDDEKFKALESVEEFKKLKEKLK